MRIAIDVDDVLADTLPAFTAYLQRQEGLRFGVEAFHSARWEDVLGITTDELGDKLELFFSSPEFRSVGPAQGSQDALQALARAHELHVVSARWDCIAEYTRAWLEEHFPGHFHGVHFAHNHYSLRASSGLLRPKKHEILVREDLGVIIEDSLEYAEQCAASGFDVILFHRPWNAGGSHAQFRRVIGWNEVGMAVEEIGGRRKTAPRGAR